MKPFSPILTAAKALFPGAVPRLQAWKWRERETLGVGEDDEEDRAIRVGKGSTHSSTRPRLTPLTANLLDRRFTSQAQLDGPVSQVGSLAKDGESHPSFAAKLAGQSAAALDGSFATRAALRAANSIETRGTAANSSPSIIGSVPETSSAAFVGTSSTASPTPTEATIFDASPSVDATSVLTPTQQLAPASTDTTAPLLRTASLALAPSTTFAALAATPNAIVLENQKIGNPQSEWDLPNGIGSTNIEGFATDISVNHGQRVDFKIKTTSSNYRIDVYRLGYYGGLGARKVATIQHSTPAFNQPNPLTNSATKLVDAGNWSVTDSWDIPADVTSGVYIAKLVRQDGTAGQNHIPFIVRADESRSNVVFQTADTTWQAYNAWGGQNLYGGTTGAAYAVSYNRPIITRAGANQSGPQDFIFGVEYPAIRWLEQNGYDTSYVTGVDVARSGSLLLNHKVFLSVGHDEYWSGEQRANVEAAREAGVNLQFWSGNECYWKTRWETSIDASGTAFRTMVCYKETKANQQIDPTGIWTGTWRDPRFSPPADGGRPENALSGTMFQVDSYRLDTINIPFDMTKLRLWRNTRVANTAAGQTATLNGTYLGYEWDIAPDNGFSPDGLIKLSSSTYNVSTLLLDYGSTVGNGVATHNLTMYRDASSGAIVFGAGTVYWSWALDANHDLETTPVDSAVQQAMVNLFADMGVQPETLQASLVMSAASTDTVAPNATITSLANGQSVATSRTVTISGTAADVGGVVAGVEVSTDGGASWRSASGTATWSYQWTTPSVSGVSIIKARATDDSVNTQVPLTSISVSVGTGVNSPPVAAADTGFVATKDTALVIAAATLLANDTDPDNDALSINGVSAATNGSVAYNATTRAVTFTPNAGYTGAAGFTYAISDGRGGTASAGVSLTVSAPSVTASLFPATLTPAVLTDSDPNSVELGVRFQAAAAGTINGIRFYKGPQNLGTHTGALWTSTGTLLSSVTFTNETASGWQTMNFAAPVQVSANTTYVASYHTNGFYSVSGNTFSTAYTNGDLTALGGSNGVYSYGTGIRFPTLSYNNSNYFVDVLYARTATVPNTPPVANPDSGFSTLQNAALSISGTTLLANDTDANADPLNITGVTAPTNGTVAFNATTNTVTFTPTANYTGAAGFTYAISDGKGGTASAAVSLNVTIPPNIPPIANPDSGFSTLLNTPLVISGTTLLANDTDANADPLTITGVSTPSNGTVAFNATTNSVTFTPSANYTGTAGFTYAISDGKGGTASAGVSLSVTATPNNPPLANPDTGFKTVQNTALTLATSSLLANDTDPDGDTLSVTGISGASNGTVALNTQTNSIVFTPTSGYTGPAGFSYAISDGKGGTASSTVGLSVTAPVATASSLFSSTDLPGNANVTDRRAVVVGVKFQAATNGTISALKFFKGSRNTGTHDGQLWTSTGTLLGTARFTSETASGWQTANFASPIAIAANTTYVASYSSNAYYALTQNYFSAAKTSGPLTAPSSATSGGNGVYAYGSAGLFPNLTSRASNYWVDVVFNGALAG